MLLGTEFIYFFIYLFLISYALEFWVVVVYRILNYSVSPYDRFLLYLQYEQ